ncbi:MAG: lamin tail domain-containing protein [Candidatus Fermentibacter daniensis]
MMIQILVIALSGQTPVLSEVMANPLNEDCCEFVEISNPSASPVDLAGFSLTDGDALDTIQAWNEAVHGTFPDSDAVTGTTIIPPGGYAVLLETGYVSDPAYDFPPGTIILTTGDAAICNGLAASSDPLTLFDAGGTADSNAVSTYGTPVPSDNWSERDDDGLDDIPFDPGDGFSVERLSDFMPDASGSWIAGPFGGSPGTGPGSSSGPDLSCTGVVLQDAQPAPGLPIQASATFLYTGSQPCPSGTLSLFVDLDADSALGPGETELVSVDPFGMLPGERDTIFASVTLPAGWYCITGLARCSQDSFPANDASTACAAPAGGVPPVISEVMADPIDEDCDEFIEIYYGGPGAYPLAGSRITDGDAVDILIPWTGELPGPGLRTSQWLPSGCTAVVLDPEYPFGSRPYAFPESTVIATVGNTTLGNGLTTDDPVTLYGPFGTGLVDVLSTYGTPVPSDDPLLRDDDGLDGIPLAPGNGCSAERISLNGPDAEFNWAASGPGGSPGVVPPPLDSLDLCLAGFWIEPVGVLSTASPAGLVSLRASVGNFGGLPADGATLTFFLDMDADSSASPLEVIASLPVPYSAPGSLDTLETVLDLEDGCWLIGASVYHPDDFDPSNDTALRGYSAGECPSPVISEVMCNPSSEDTDEYVELWFPGPGVFNLEGCRICDGDALDVLVPWRPELGAPADPDASTGMFMPAGSFTVILDAEYCLGAQPWDFAPGTRVITTANTTIGDGLSGRDPLLLYSAAGTDTTCIMSTYGTPVLSNDPLLCDDDGLDSIPFDPGEGLAVHRILLAGPDSEGNWIASNPSPGSDPPSVHQGVDFSPVRLTLEPPFGEDGRAVAISSVIANLGTVSIPEGDLRVVIYADLDHSSTPSPSEVILARTPPPPAPGDSIPVETSWFGTHSAVPVIVFTSCAGDSIASDDTLRVEWNRATDLVINEIMYRPNPGEPEWIELHNRSEYPVQLAGVVLSDSREDVTITADSILVEAGGYVILAPDSAEFRDAWPDAPGLVIEPPSWPALNDQIQPGREYADDVRISLSCGQALDMVPYAPSWGGSAGRSLEKIDPAASGWLSTSWTTCSGTGTPNERNSSYNPDPGHHGFLSCEPDPFSPDGDGVDDALSIHVEGEGHVTVEIYNVQGRRLLTLADGLQSGGVFTVSWNGLDSDGGRLSVGRYIVFARLEKSNGEVREKAAVVVLARRL